MYKLSICTSNFKLLLRTVTVDHNEGPSQLFCPYIYASGNAGRGGAEQQGGRCIGRAVVYKQAR